MAPWTQRSCATPTRVRLVSCASWSGTSHCSLPSRISRRSVHRSSRVARLRCWSGNVRRRRPAPVRVMRPAWLRWWRYWQHGGRALLADVRYLVDALDSWPHRCADLITPVSLRRVGADGSVGCAIRYNRIMAATIDLPEAVPVGEVCRVLAISRATASRQGRLGYKAAGQGLEPRLPDPESGVLPLDDPATARRRIPEPLSTPA